MKKLLVSLLVLACVAPAMAANVTATSANSVAGEVTVTLTADAGIVGISLKVDASAGPVTGAAMVESFFDVFIDSMYSNSGYGIGEGMLTASQTGAGELALPQNHFSICVGLLDDDGIGSGTEEAPLVAHLTLTGTPGDPVVIDEDTLRGGVVGYDGAMVISGLPISTTFGAPVVTETITTPSVAKTTAAPAVGDKVNGGRVETFVASGAVSSLGHTLEYQFTWGDGNVGAWGSATQTHTYTYAAATSYNVTVQAHCATHTTVLSAVSAPLALTSEPVKSTAPIYTDWCSFGRKNCWAFTRNCRGDADGKRQGTSTTGYKYVSSNDLTVLLAAWNINEPTKGVGMANINVALPTGDTINGICADFNRDRQGTSTTGYKRVSSNDFPILLANWNINEPTKGPGVPSCSDTGHYHYMINP